MSADSRDVGEDGDGKVKLLFAVDKGTELLVLNEEAEPRDTNGDSRQSSEVGVRSILDDADE